MSVTQVSTPSKIYYDVTITNFENTGDVLPPVVTFNETRSIPFLYDPEQYYLSIVRFQLDTPSLPVFIPSIQIDQSNNDLTIYSVQLQWTNNAGTTTYSSGEKFVTWKPQFQVAPPPPPSKNIGGIQDNSTGYYYCISYQWFAELVNEAMAAAQVSLNTIVGASADAADYPLTTYSPILGFVADTGLFSISFISSSYSYQGGLTNGATYPIKLIFNSPLYQLFSSLPSTISFPNNLTNFITILTDNLSNTEISNAMVVSFIIVKQEYSTIALWTPVTGIVFCSNTLPIVPNQLSAPVIFSQGIPKIYGNNSNFQQVITDFVSENGIYKPSIVYNPTAEYRLVELLGNTALTNLDISVFWKDRIGQFIPFRLTSGSSATIKILFTKKASYASK